MFSEQNEKRTGKAIPLRGQALCVANRGKASAELPCLISCEDCNGRFSAEVYNPGYAARVLDTEEEAKDWVADVLASVTMREALE